MEWLNKLVATLHQHGTDYAWVDRSRTTWQLVSSSPGCIRKSYHNWPELVAGNQCISCRSGHLLVLFTGAVLGNTHILHCQTLSVIPLPLVRPRSTCFHTFQDSIIRSVDKPVQARILLLVTYIPYSKCWNTAGWVLCKLRMAFKQILADLTQETANYGSFFGYSLEMKIPVAK